ncbi:hypothetical protein ACTXT7_005087 [Hymenolepis weldensis]
MEVRAEKKGSGGMGEEQFGDISLTVSLCGRKASSSVSVQGLHAKICYQLTEGDKAPSRQMQGGGKWKKQDSERRGRKIMLYDMRPSFIE